jgi:rhodanese-related sulfurtransferase
VAGRVREIDPKTAAEWLQRGEAVLIDVREADEHARERIKGARLAPLSCFDPGVAAVEVKVIMHCHSGSRSVRACVLAGEQGDVYSMAGGIEGWKRAGLAVERGA